MTRAVWITIGVGIALFGLGPLLANLEWVAPMTGFGLFALGPIVAIIGTILAGIAWWRGGRRKVFAPALVVGLLPVGVVVGVSLTSDQAPPINDISTDLEDPPEFVRAAEVPELQGADLSYPESFVPIVEAHYDHLEPLVVPWPRSTVVTVAANVADEQFHEVTWIAADDRQIEAVDVSGVFHFRDDIVIRLRDTRDGGTRIDVRSRSRVGRGDMGVNAARIERFLDALSTRLANADAIE